MRHILFVYGGMRRGKALHHVLQSAGATFIAKGFIDGYMMYNFGSYVGIAGGWGQVFGEIFVVPDEAGMDLIDRASGMSSGRWERVPADATVDRFHDEETQTVEVIAYIAKVPLGTPTIPKGIAP